MMDPLQNGSTPRPDGPTDSDRVHYSALCGRVVLFRQMIALLHQDLARAKLERDQFGERFAWPAPLEADVGNMTG